MKCQAKKLSKNYNCNPFYLLQVRLTVPSFVFAVSIKPRFNVLSGFLKSAFTQFDGSLYWWVLINFVTQLLGLFTDRNDTFSPFHILKVKYLYLFIYLKLEKGTLFGRRLPPPSTPPKKQESPIPGSRGGGGREKGRGLIWIRKLCRRKKKWKEEMA